MRKAVIDPDVPVEATYYLYGTPSESGNVALADGERCALYKAYILPNIHDVYTPELRKTHPYACISFGLGMAHGEKYYLSISPSPFYGRVSAGYIEDFFTEWNHVASVCGDNGWGEFETSHAYVPMVGGMLWTNHNIVDDDTEQLLVAKSDPIPLASSEPVAAVYGEIYSAMLPILPQWDKGTYPYAVIWRGNENDRLGTIPYWLFISKSPCRHIYKGGSEWAIFFDDETASYSYVYGNSENYWEYTGTSENLEKPNNSYSAPNNCLVWHNHDILDEYDRVDEKSPDPIPVYEEKE